MQNLLLLHGALGSAAMFDDLKEALQAHFQVYTLDFTGHGGRELPQTSFGMALFAADILDLLDKEGLASVSIFGYSMGGYAALYFALLHPERVKHVFTLATKFAWSPEAAAKEARLLNPEKMAVKVPAFAAALAHRHAPQDWKLLVTKTADMMRDLGEQSLLSAEKLAQVQIPVQVAVGDRDAMVSLEETAWAYGQLPEARLLVLPQTRHPLETVPIQRLSYELLQFLQV
ncbi:alpha/beta fold hydrolase [Pontibacter liquoris]|uniref:alpha/beta fold hydrolase n=1 Tax=Pontibacter liquoris TaxID=2905677 RepID=UPI001FA6AFB3|nr:alpha/beta hydrolase [Pontibacter liquoris]